MSYECSAPENVLSSQKIFPQRKKKKITVKILTNRKNDFFSVLVLCTQVNI